MKAMNETLRAPPAARNPFSVPADAFDAPFRRKIPHVPDLNPHDPPAKLHSG